MHRTASQCIVSHLLVFIMLRARFLSWCMVFGVSSRIFGMQVLRAERGLRMRCDAAYRLVWAPIWRAYPAVIALLICSVGSGQIAGWVSSRLEQPIALL